MAYRDPQKKAARRKEYNSRPKSRRRAAAAQARWRERHPEKAAHASRNKQLKHKYGITVEEYESLLIEQGGVCAICRRPPTAVKSGRRLAVDHDHETLKIRGLVCQPCNVILGSARDLPEVLMSAILYLRRHGR